MLGVHTELPDDVDVRFADRETHMSVGRSVVHVYDHIPIARPLNLESSLVGR